MLPTAEVCLSVERVVRRAAESPSRAFAIAAAALQSSVPWSKGPPLALSDAEVESCAAVALEENAAVFWPICAALAIYRSYCQSKLANFLQRPTLTRQLLQMGVGSDDPSLFALRLEAVLRPARLLSLTDVTELGGTQNTPHPSFRCFNEI